MTFKNHFIMSDEEVATLTSTAEPVNDNFFRSLSRAKKINRDCELLLGFEGQALGLDLMEQSSRNINFGFQKLYKWVQREFKTLDLENPQMSVSIRRALRVLTERPALFQSCLDFFAEARERFLSDAFHVALTGASSPDGGDTTVKPIDLAAHDPLRYVGDMFAWIHSATVSENEALEVLFIAEDGLVEGLKSGRDAEVWRLVADEDGNGDDFDAPGALDNLVDQNIAGALRALSQRVEQVVRSNEETVSAYELAMLVRFYRITFQKLLAANSSLVCCTASLEEEALRQFRSLVRDRIAALRSDFQQTPSDLGPPPFLLDALRDLTAIMRTFESSLPSSEDRESEFHGVMAEAFDPFMSGCDNMATSLGAPNDTIFLINCSQAAASCIQEFEFTAPRTARLHESIRSRSARLIQDQHRFLCEGSGLATLLSGSQGPFQDVAEPLTRDRLVGASQQLDNFLPSAMIDAMERVKRLQDTTLVRQVTEEAANLFCRDFEELELRIARLDEQSGVEHELGLRCVFPRTTAEIRVLLS